MIGLNKEEVFQTYRGGNYFDFDKKTNRRIVERWKPKVLRMKCLVINIIIIIIIIIISLTSIIIIFSIIIIILIIKIIKGEAQSPAN